ncbi:MAG: hypothetical protein KF836_01630 [Fimbriimonadaceae bacterium]|nr:hypothetical protein [Fimbriimonadaceae bacterium]
MFGWSVFEEAGLQHFVTYAGCMGRESNAPVGICNHCRSEVDGHGPDGSPEGLRFRVVSGSSCVERGGRGGPSGWTLRKSRG